MKRINKVTTPPCGLSAYDPPIKDWTDREIWTAYARCKDERWHKQMDEFELELRRRGMWTFYRVKAMVNDSKR